MNAPPPPGGFGTPDLRPASPRYVSGPPRSRIFLWLAIGAVVVAIAAFASALSLLRSPQGTTTAEHTNALGQIGKLAKLAYERDGRLCPSASQPVPVDARILRGRKYQSAAGDWTIDADRHAGFACLGFEMTAPQYYQYDYRAEGDTFVATAHGDLDGDGKLSTFRLTGKVVGKTVELSPPVKTMDGRE